MKKAKNVYYVTIYFIKITLQGGVVLIVVLGSQLVKGAVSLLMKLAVQRQVVALFMETMTK